MEVRDRLLWLCFIFPLCFVGTHAQCSADSPSCTADSLSPSEPAIPLQPRASSSTGNTTLTYLRNIPYAYLKKDAALPKVQFTTFQYLTLAQADNEKGYQLSYDFSNLNFTVGETRTSVDPLTRGDIETTSFFAQLDNGGNVTVTLYHYELAASIVYNPALIVNITAGTARVNMNVQWPFSKAVSGPGTTLRTISKIHQKDTVLMTTVQNIIIDRRLSLAQSTLTTKDADVIVSFPNFAIADNRTVRITSVFDGGYALNTYPTFRSFLSTDVFIALKDPTPLPPASVDSTDLDSELIVTTTVIIPSVVIVVLVVVLGVVIYIVWKKKGGEASESTFSVKEAFSSAKEKVATIGKSKSKKDQGFHWDDDMSSNSSVSVTVSD